MGRCGFLGGCFPGELRSARQLVPHEGELAHSLANVAHQAGTSDPRSIAVMLIRPWRNLAARRELFPHAILTTTLPAFARPFSAYSSASRVDSNGKTVSTTGWILPASIRRVSSRNWSPLAFMNRNEYVT